MYSITKLRRQYATRERERERKREREREKKRKREREKEREKERKKIEGESKIGRDSERQFETIQKV